MDRPIRVAILTVSDRSARGERPDAAGPLLAQAVERHGWQVSETAIVPDDRLVIEQTLADWCDSACCDLLLTTGGTGFAPRDVTPEATLSIIQRVTPGLAELMRLESLKITPHAALSRAVAGIRARTLIINLPGSPKGAVENLGFLMPILPHAIDLLQDSPSAEAGH